MRSGVLVHNEFIKARRRPAVWVSLGVFVGLMSLIFGGMFVDGLRRPDHAFVLPAAWKEVLGGPGVLSAFFASILLILLVSSEFTWRTARQNVIDGMAKEEFFVAKLILLPALAVSFFGALLVVSGGFGAAGTMRIGAQGPMLRAVDAAHMGGSLLGLFGWASFAFFLALTIRSSGAAIGAFCLYFIVEQIVGGLAGSVGATAAKVAHFLPVAIFKSLWEPVYYGSVPLKAGQTLPMPTSLLLAVGTLYVVGFIAVAFLVYRRRDL